MTGIAECKSKTGCQTPSCQWLPDSRLEGPVRLSVLATGLAPHISQLATTGNLASGNCSALRLPALLNSPLLNRSDHAEDRQVHGHDHAADDDAEEHDHHRLHQGQQGARPPRPPLRRRSRRSCVSISSRPPVCSPTAIIEITMGGNTFDFWSGAAMVSPPAMRRPRFHDRVVDHAVAGGLGRDLEPVEDRDARRDQRAERAREARHGRLADARRPGPGAPACMRSRLRLAGGRGVVAA